MDSFFVTVLNIKREHFILFLAGTALSIAQFIMIRDFVTVLYGEEVVIILVTAAFFSGMSVGYLLSLKFTEKTFHILFVVMAFVHLTFPFSYRYIAVLLEKYHYGGFSYLAMLFAYALLFSSLFTAFLPRIIHASDDPESGLKIFYSVELAGFLFGFIIIGLTWNQPVKPLLMTYWVLLGGMLYLVANKREAYIFTLFALLISVFFLDKIDLASSSALYQHKHHMRDAEVLYSVNSPYQRVEVVKDENGDLNLYLDGLLNLNSSDLESLNYYIAELPAMLTSPNRALIVGNGTLSSVSKVYPHANETVSVELDPSVLNAGFMFYTPVSLLKGYTNWHLYNDDGKNFLRKSEKPYDLIIMDIPSPLTIQEAYLHTTEFYQLAKSRLSENGIIAVQLSGRLEMNDRTPAQVAGALATAFEEVMAVYSPRAKRGFAYAGRKLPFGGRDLLRVAKDYDIDTEVIPPENIKYFLKDSKPFSVNHMELVLRRGFERFWARYFQ